MIQLGISAFYHDSAACIVKDGKVLAAVEEERFTGIKHDSSFPIHSIHWLLEYLEIEMDDIDRVCWYENPDLKKERVLETFKKHPLKNFWNRRKFLKRHRVEGNIQDVLITHLNYRGPIDFVEHHLSHAAFSYYTSPYKDAAVVSIDGVGEWETVSIYCGLGNHLYKMESEKFPNSMGMFYSTFTAFLGFKPNEGEYKIMGLAPYGDYKVYYQKLSSLITLKDNGRFEIDQKHFTWEHSDEIMFKKSLAFYLGLKPRISSESITRDHRNLAAALQRIYEIVFLHILSHAKKISSSDSLCLSGGCAYNGVANQKAYHLFKHVWVPFAPSDAGSAIGACLASLRTTRRDNTDPYLGPEYDDFDIAKEIEKFKDKIQVEEAEEDAIIMKAATAIHSGQIVGLFQGRMEFGARALGNRSILASPLQKGMKNKLNRVVKKREGFRPFAPSCTEEDASTYFENVEPIPYMSQVVNVKLKYHLPSITHIDGTARLQTVNKNQNKYYHKLLKQVGALSGYPICLNTSFNFKDQTITMTPYEAIERFLDCDMDALVINNFYITKSWLKKSSTGSKRN
jgi:carbamoyltransferase